MRPSEVTGFSSSDYHRRICNKPHHQLIHDIYKKRRALIISTVGAVSGVACAAVSGGLSLVGTAISARTHNVERRKLDLLEQEWSRRGGSRLPKRHVKDMLIPLVISTTVGAFTFSMDLGMSNACLDSAIATAYSTQLGLPAEAFPKEVIEVFFAVMERGILEGGERFNAHL